MYLHDFQLANQFRNELNLESYEFSLDTKRYLTDKRINGLRQCLQEGGFGSLSPEQVSGGCLAVNSRFQSIIEAFLKCKTFYTIGYVKEPQRVYWKHTPKDLKEWSDTGIENFNEINIHTWLTLPSLEIIDLTIGTTFALEFNDEDFLGMLLMGHPSEIINYSYHPTILGEDVLKAMGAKIEL